MKVMAFNGSPRKSWNTATVLDHALRGAASEGAETELIHLYEYDYKGCHSCFACKLKGGKNYGHCAVSDDLKPLLKKAEDADAIFLGSPIYFGMPTGEMRSFLERLMFQYLVYDAERSTLFPRKMPVGLIYTMNVGAENMSRVGYDRTLNGTEMALRRIFGSAESLFVNDTYQFDDYAKYETSAFDEAAKAKRRLEVFPEDCRQAFAMGARFVKLSNSFK
jgi:multimeric flavodoxin WrbA